MSLVGGRRSVALEGTFGAARRHRLSGLSHVPFLLGLTVIASTTDAFGQSLQPEPERTPQTPAEQGVTTYPPSFFSAMQPTSAYDMVIRVPGFTFDKGTVVRGLADAAGNVLVDGQQPVSKNDTLDEILKRIPASAVERIDLIRGGAEGIDMAGRSILVNVVRRRAAGFQAATSLSNYFVADGRVMPGVRAEEQWRWSGGRAAELAQTLSTGPSDDTGSGSRVRRDSHGADLIRSKVDGASGGTRFWNSAAYETPFWGGQARLNGALQFNRSKPRITDAALTSGAIEAERNVQHRNQGELGGRYNRTVTARLALETVALLQSNSAKTVATFRSQPLNRDFVLDRRSFESVARVQLRYTAGRSLTLEGGAEGAFNALDSQTALTLNGTAQVLPAANVRVSENRGELFVRAAWRASPSLNLEAGVRQEASWITSEGDVVLEKALQYLKPRLALTWSPSPSNQVRVRLEREVGQLSFDDFVASPNVVSTGTVVAGNPDLNPQQAWVFEAVYERRFWEGGALVLAGRRAELHDAVDRIPIFAASGTAVADAPGNIGNGRRDEIQISLTLPLDKLQIAGAQLRGSLTRRRTEVTDPLLLTERAISAVRPVEWDLHLTQNLASLRTVWGADLTGGFRERYFRLTEVETKKVSPVLLVYAEYKPRPDLTIRVEGQGVNAHTVGRIREVYVGPRNLGTLSFVDVRNLQYAGALYLRVRKTFG